MTLENLSKEFRKIEERIHDIHIEYVVVERGEENFLKAHVEKTEHPAEWKKMTEYIDWKAVGKREYYSRTYQLDDLQVSTAAINWINPPFQYGYESESKAGGIALAHRDVPSVYFDDASVYFSVRKIAFEPIGYHLSFSDVLLEESRKPDGVIRVASEGDMQWIQFRSGDGSGVSYRFRPTRGWMPDRIEQFQADGRLDAIYEECELKEVEPGIWFPVRARLLEFGDFTGEWELMRTVEYKASYVKVNDEITEQSLSFGFPKGTKVFNRIGEFQYIVGKEDLSIHLKIEKAIDEFALRLRAAD
ncbi:MAG: hypothetical protein HYU36_21670 [Planctomycetes bacterium]|nr:hypothetical protein [Planctomycetota bacterium]